MNGPPHGRANRPPALLFESLARDSKGAGFDVGIHEFKHIVHP